MTDFSEQRSCIKLCFELGKSATETLGVLRSIYGKNALCRSKTFHWYSRFRDGQTTGGKPVVSKDFTPFNNSLKPNGKKPIKRRKTMETSETINHPSHNINNHNNYSALEAQLNYVKMLMKLGKPPSETYTCMQALFGPNAISRIDLLQLYLKLEADEKLSKNILPPVIKPPSKRQRTSLPQTAVHEVDLLKQPPKLQSQSRMDLMTGGSFWHAPSNDEKENTSLTENQVCFMDHFMLSGDSSRDSYKIMLPKSCDVYQADVCDNGVDRFVPLPVPVENLNRMHVMDGDCTKADIVAEKAPQLQLHSPAAAEAAAANGHEGGEEDVKPGLKGVVTMKELPKETSEQQVVVQSEKDAVKSNGESLEENGPVVNGSDNNVLVTSEDKSEDKSSDSDTKTNLVNGDSKVVDDENEDEKMAVDESEPKLENGLGLDVPMSTDEDVAKDEVEEEEKQSSEQCVVKKEEVEEESVEKKVEEKKEEKKEEEEESVATSRKEEAAKEEVGVTAVSEEDEERSSVTSSQNRKRRLADTNGDGENCDNEAEGEAEMEGEAEAEGEVEGEASSSDSESGTKRQRVEVEGEDERERLVREYVERCTQTVEEMSRNADKLQREIGALGELARAKELEWNSILRLRKLKEEMLERLLRRRRQTMMLADNGLNHDWPSDFNKSKANKPTSNNHLMMVPIVSSSPGNSTPSLGGSGAGGALSRAAAAAAILSAPDTTRLTRLQRPILPKPSSPAQGVAGVQSAAAAHLIDQQNTVIGEGRQGPILDVKSIIADYRSRHPADNVPRRGRRQKSLSAAAAAMVTSTRITGSPALMSMANMALCSGAHIRNNSQDCAVTGQENSRPSSTDSTRSTSMHSESTTSTTLPAPGLNFKDVLVQFAKMSQPPAAVTSLVPSGGVKNPHPPPPPPYPEVTLHPVPAPNSHNSPSPPTSSSSHTSSLLHGILTKSSPGGGVASSTSSSGVGGSHRPTTFSPTLARLLTAPERERPVAPSVAASHLSAASAASASHFRPPVSRVSISDLLTTSKKTRNEITITPVSSHSSHPKSKDGVVLLEDDPEETDSTDRLVIDESAGVDGKDEGGAAGAGAGDEAVPECQGCQQRAAQFVCAGCGNQWYCSRECQVTAWEEHSEMCSG